GWPLGLAPSAASRRGRAATRTRPRGGTRPSRRRELAPIGARRAHRVGSPPAHRERYATCSPSVRGGRVRSGLFGGPRECSAARRRTAPRRAYVVPPTVLPEGS